MPDRIAVDLLHRAADGVGESLQWMAEEKALYWVDITGRAIKRCEPGSGRVDQWSVPGMPARSCRARKAG